MSEVKGKVALVTGGAMGMGRAVAERLARDGARVVLWDLDEAALKSAGDEMKKTGAEVYTYVLDITDRARVYDTGARVKQDVGEVDILVNNAGVVSGGLFWEVPDEELFKTIDVNVNAIMWCTKAFLPDMIKKGSGHLVQMASAAGMLGVPGLTAYCASKHAVIGLSDTLRLELKKMRIKGIRITIVCPSFVQTGMFEGVQPPFLSPWLTTDQMADKIYAGLGKDKYYVREPFLVKLVPFLKGITQTSVLDWFGGIMGMHTSMDAWKGRGG
jgi:all-trans-retinol dehydrogenase (NAD+)